MVNLHLTLLLSFLTVCSSFNVTRNNFGDRFTNPTCRPENCNSTFDANNGCIKTWNSCCFCQCYEGYTYRSDLEKCLGSDSDLHLGCLYRFDDGNYGNANLKLVTIQSGAPEQSIGGLKILPTITGKKKKSNGNLGKCTVEIEESDFLVSGQWKTFDASFNMSGDFFIGEKNKDVYLKWGGSDISPYKGLIIKLKINCTKAGESCIVFKVSGTRSWPDSTVSTDATTLATEHKATGSMGGVSSNPPSETVKSTPNDNNLDNGPGTGDRRAQHKDDNNENSSDQVKTAAIGAGAAILFVLVLMFAVYNIIMRKRAQRNEREKENPQTGFSSAVYQDTEPMRRSRDYTYDKPLEPIYDEVGNSIYNKDNMANKPFLSSFKPGSKSVSPVEKAPLQDKSLHREPSEKNGMNNSRPLPKTPDQIDAEAAVLEGRYMSLSCSAEKSSPLHADNPVYQKPETTEPVDSGKGNDYAVLEKDENREEEATTMLLPAGHDYSVLEADEEAQATTKLPACHDYALLEADEEAPATTNLPAGHDYAVLEADEEAQATTNLPAGHDYSVLEADEEAQATTKLPEGHDFAVAVKDKSSAHNYEKLILKEEPSPYQSLV